jgi:DNA anti-recombination protein RmuC
VRAGQADLLAAQAAEACRLAAECVQLESAARQLARAGGDSLRDLEARLAGTREAALESGRRSRASLSASLQELAARIRDLAARPRVPPSPFTRIGRPMLVDLRS